MTGVSPEVQSFGGEPCSAVGGGNVGRIFFHMVRPRRGGGAYSVGGRRQRAKKGKFGVNIVRK